MDLANYTSGKNGMWLGRLAHFCLRTWSQNSFFYFRAGKFWSAAPNRGIVTKVNRSNDTNFSVIGVDKGIQFHPFEGQMAVDKPTR